MCFVSWLMLSFLSKEVVWCTLPGLLCVMETPAGMHHVFRLKNVLNDDDVLFVSLYFDRTVLF